MSENIKDKTDAEMWYWCAVKAFLIVALLAIMSELFFAIANGGSSSFVYTWGAYVWAVFAFFAFMGPFIFWDLVCASFAVFFPSWAQIIKLRTPLYKAVVLGGCASFIIYGGEFLLLIFLRNEIIADFLNLQWFLFRVIAFTLIYTYEVYKADLRDKSEKNGAHKIKG